MIDSTRNDYYRTQLSSAGNNKKQTYSIVNQLLDRDLSKGIYPNDKPENIVASEMKDYFENKISNIYSEFDCGEDDRSNCTYLPEFKGSFLQNFKPISENELISIISELFFLFLLFKTFKIAINEIT